MEGENVNIMSNSDVENEVNSLRKEIELLRKENGLLIQRVESLQDGNESERSSISVKEYETNTNCVPSIRFGINEIREIIEPFDPANESNTSPTEWIKKIDDKTTLFYATLRLQGAAKYWQQSKQAELKTWKDFKIELERSFPTGKDDSAVLLKIMSRKRRRDECVENYFYSIAAMAKRIKLSEMSTINYVISGLGDNNLRNVLTAANCKTLPELLTQIKRFEDIENQERRRDAIASCSSTCSKFNQRIKYNSRFNKDDSAMKHKDNGRSNSKDNGRNSDSNNPQKVLKRTSMVRCYKCDGIGHYAKECTLDKKTRTCYLCKQKNHFARDCPNKSVGRIGRNVISENSEYYPEVTIEGVRILAFLDLGSDVTTITHETVLRNTWKINGCDLILYGFGGSKCKVIGKIEKVLKVGEVEQKMTLLVVPNNAQTTPIIVGKDFLDRPGVKKIN